MFSPTPRFESAIDAFDAVNREDPHRVMVDGVDAPKELLYARRMSDRLARFAPDAPEALRLAVRCQHIRRWSIPRDAYPMDRIGYLRWRTTLYKFHADLAGQLLAHVGYDPGTIARVQFLVRKEKLKADPDSQTLEDVICLVFLEHYFAEFAAQHPRDKVIAIVQKTWKKMSEHAQAEALKLPLSAEVTALVTEALTPEA